MKMKATSSVYGKIEEILIAIEGEKEGLKAEDIKKQFGLVISAFRDRQEIVCLGNFAEGESVTQALGAHLLKPVCTEYGEQHDEWVQDPFCVLSGPEGVTTLLEPYFFEKINNRFLAEQLSHGHGTLIRSTRFHLEGGNILVGDDYMLVGMDCAEENRVKVFGGKIDLEEACEKLTKDFRELFGVNYVIWIGSKSPLTNPLKMPMGPHLLQPIFHIDMFLTLGGKSNSEKHQGDELVFVADIHFNPSEVNPYDDVKGHEENDPRFVHLNEFKNSLDETARYLEEYHLNQPGPQFHVKRLPMQVILSEQEETTVYSYNNCLVEYYHGIRRAYLPQFRLLEHNGENPRCECSHCRARKAFEGLGFRVTFVDDTFDQRAKLRGGLHCITKVLRRSHP